MIHPTYVDIDALHCPGCSEPVTDAPPVRWSVPGRVPRWSHSDGSELCPEYGPRGVEPCEPVEIHPVILTLGDVAAFDAISANYGPFTDEWSFTDVIDLIDGINRATNGDMAWATASTIFAYMRRIGIA